MRHVAMINKGATYLRIHGFDHEFLNRVISPFCRHTLSKWAKKPQPGGAKAKWEVTHVFARSNYDKTEFRLPGSLLAEFLEAARRQGFNTSRILIKDDPILNGVPVELKLKPGFDKARDYQDEWINYKLAEGQLKINGAATGQGKAIWDETPVRTIDGWVPIKDIVVGDLVMAPDGSYTHVTGVFPQGITPTFKLTFKDGRTILACPQHQWEVKESNGLEWVVMSTQELVDNIKTGLSYSIPLTLPERNGDFDDVDDLYAQIYNKTPLSKDLVEGSYAQRLRLIRGIGRVSDLEFSGDSFSIVTPLLHHAEVFQLAIWSVGGIAELIDKQGYYKVECRHRNPATFFLFPQESNIPLDLAIVSIEPNEPLPTTCIAVAHHTHCFVVKDFIVTHNTYMTLFALVKLGRRAIITIQPRFIVTWLNDISKTLDVEPEDILVWENSDLELLASNLEKGLLNPKIIILPVSRISTWQKDCKKDPDKAELDVIYERMGVGVRIYDEVHESFHEVTLSLLYGNFMKTIVLSATLKSDDPVLNDMYQKVLPKEFRLKEPDAEHYIDIVALLYQIDVRRYKPKTMQAGAYNDLVFEQWILDNPDAFTFYFNLAKEMYEDYYLTIREKDTKCLFFFSRVEMCLRMVEAFRKEYPSTDFDSYLGTLDKKTPTKYLEHEVLFSTPSSCGTGKDIPGLVRCFGFPTIKSQQKGKQMIGRLRDLTRKNEFDGRITPLYCFACCVDIPQQRDCYDKRRVDFEPKQKSWKKMTSSHALN
jgi:hypothetical protein